MDIRSTPAFADARRIIQAWSPYYPTLSQAVLEALGTLQIYATDYYTEYPVQGCDRPGERPLFAYDANLVGAVVLDRPGPDNPAIDSLIVPGTSFDADRKSAQLAWDYRKVCQEFAEVERRLGRPEVSCKITNPDLDRQAIALVDLVNGEIGKHDPEFNIRNHLFDFQQKLRNIQDNAITMSVGGLLSSPEER